MRDLSEQQSELFFLIVTFLLEYQPADLGQLIDADVAEATAALAATFETAARGVIYEHRATSLPAERLAISLKPMLVELERAGGSAFQRDAAVVLRRVAAAAHDGTAESTRQSPRVPRADWPCDADAGPGRRGPRRSRLENRRRSSHHHSVTGGRTGPSRSGQAS